MRGTVKWFDTKKGYGFITDSEGKEHDSYSGSSVRVRVPSGKRPGYGYGGKMLSGRGGEDEDEASPLQKQRLYGLSGYGCVCGYSGCDWKVCAAACMDILAYDRG